MKRIFTILFAAMLAGQAWAEDNFDFSAVCSTGQTLFYLKINSTEVKVSCQTIGTMSGNPWYYGPGPKGDLVIPETVEYEGVNYTVTEISGLAFENCKDLYSVVIPNSVTKITDGSFEGCDYLTEIYVQSSNAKYISENGILFTKDKKTLACYPAGKKDTAYSIPNTVTRICSYAFNNCRNLTSVTIPKSVTNIGDDAFEGCSGLTSVTIPNSVTSIGDEAFWYCSGLTTITIPNSVTSIGSLAFYGCSGLTSVTIPNSVTSIGNYAFRDCSGLTSVTIPNSVTSIGDAAFYNCSKLTSVTIPNSVTSIGSEAFSFCRGLKQITCYATYDYGLPTLGNQAFSNNSCTVTVPCGQTDYYKESDWGGYSNFTYAEDYLYEFTTGANYPEMGSVEILQMPDCSTPAKVKAVANNGYVFVMWDDGRSAFEIDVDVYGDRHCTAYFAPADADINIIPKNDAFWYYNSDTKTLHVGGHGELAIYSDYKWGDLPTDKVEHVFMEDGFTYIDASTFQNFTALKDVRLPATLKKIGSTAFNGCESLESVVIPEGVKEIEYAAFNNCSSMKYAVLPSTLQKMWTYAFSGCSLLDSVVVKCDTAIDLPSMVFYGGSINTKFYIPCGKKELYTSKDCWTINVTSNDNFVETMVYDLSVASSDSKRGTTAITQAPECGTNAIVTATAKPNYQFLKWSNGSTANPYEFALEKDLSLTAIFVGKQSEITVKADTNGTVIVPQYAYFEDSVEVKISPKLGYEIDKLTITADGEKLELKNNKFMMPLTNVNISATFKQIDYQITTEAENGKIIVGQTAHYGDTVMFNINSDNGYKFLSVSVKDTADKNIRLVGDNSFIMPAANVTITAIFEKEDHTPVTETAANAVNIYAHRNTIVVENATNEISVYDAMGRLVGRDAIHRVRAELQVNTAGLYIVKVGNVAKRVMVND